MKNQNPHSLPTFQRYLQRLAATIIIILFAIGSTHAADPPGILSHQGRIAVNGTNHDGPGFFKFSLVKDAGLGTEAILWHHDGTDPGTAEPAGELNVSVSQGHYALLLGDTDAGMTAIPASVFPENGNVSLRIWFSTTSGSGYEQLAPDRRVTSSGYALSSATAGSLTDGALTAAMIADGAVTISKISPAYFSGGPQGGGMLDLSNLSTTGASYDVTFDTAFPAAPNVNLPAGWTLDGAATETGFTATSAFAPVTVDAGGNGGADEVGRDASMAVVNGRPAVSYSDTTTKRLKYAIADDADGTGTWTTVTVDDGGTAPDEVGRFTSLAVVDGRPAISYRDDTDGALKYAIADDADGTGTWTTMVVDTAGNAGLTTSLAVVNGRPAISYLASGDLRFVLANDAAGTSCPAPVTVHDGGANVVGRYSFLVVVNGYPAISYLDDTADDLKYVIATDTDGTSWATPVTVDAGGNGGVDEVGEYTSMAVVNGRPAISYYDKTNGDLKYVIADDASGTSWGSPPVAVDTDGVVGDYTSIVVVNGRPAISYRDFTNRDLKYVTADDADGAVWATPVIVDTVGLVGLYSSLTVVAGGRPAISYFDDTNNALKYALLPAEPEWTAADPGGNTVIAARAAGVVDGSITGASLAPGSITSVKLAEGSVTGMAIASGAITSSQIADGSIAAKDLDRTIGLWEAHGANISFEGGNVGIGTDAPAENLEVGGGIKLGTTPTTNAGTIRWTGTDFEGYNGSEWVSLTFPSSDTQIAQTVALTAPFMEFVTVGNPGNAADSTSYGAVAYQYQIGKYEVTNEQYAAFLNAMAVTDPNALYDTSMGSKARGGIARSGASGSYAYHVKKAMGDKPVNYVSFWDACRFCNWLHNGQPVGAQSASTTEDGAYDLTDPTAISNNTVTRKAGAKFFIPGENEWYKAAYHQPAAQGGDTDDYWLYPTQSNSVPTVATADKIGNINNDDLNVANYGRGADWNGQDGNVTAVGSGGPGSASFYEAFDMGGNVGEWNDTAISGSYRGLRGGSWDYDESGLRSLLNSDLPAYGEDFIGFRVASP